ncbi:MAG: elongation factor P [Dehalococcoidia bacterium]|nr:elongation factor P [Dehalococcoidia bacterium]MYB48646.1 elongation factor P [Dehalococcoidia bacterium]MYD50994.1 elongation factor P [Dehalococcoidia bacterium]
MTLSYGELKKGMPIALDGEPYAVVDYERTKMQQRAPVMRIRFRSLRTGRIVDRTFNGFDVKFTVADVERRKAEYIYQDGELYYFMDNETFEQFPLNADQISDSLPYMIEQTAVDLVLYQDEPISIEIPLNVDLKVTDTDPGFKGDTATGGSKPATVETGLVVQVPLFIDVGETIRIDTRTGEYAGRV